MDKDKNKLEKIRKIPQTTNLERAHTAQKIFLALLPGGSAISEIINSGVNEVLIRRNSEWQKALVQGFEELYQKFNALPEDFSRDDKFVTALLQATQVAMRTHQQEKLKVLRNVILNAALFPNLDENLNLMFLNYIDNFSPWHIKVLNFYRNPVEWAEKNGQESMSRHITEPSSLYEYVFPEFKQNPKYLDQLVLDLVNRGLLEQEDEGPPPGTVVPKYPGIPPLKWLSTPRITLFGKEFLAYIKDPF